MHPRVILPTIPDDDSSVIATVVTRFDVERYACGELDGDVARRAQVEAALAADPALKAFYDDVVASDAAFRIEAPVARFAAKLEASSSTSPSLWARLQGIFSGGRVAALSACAAAVLVVVVARPGLDVPTDVVVDDAGVRSKGGDARIGFFVNGSAGARPGSAGEALRAGDQIQLAVKDAADKRAMVVVGVDGTGAVSVYARELLDTQHKGAEPDRSVRVLPASLILDDTAGAERFFVVYGDDVSATEAAARAAAERLGRAVVAGEASLVDVERLTIDDALVQSSVHIVKVR